MSTILHPDWLDAPEIQRLAQIFAAAGESLFFVGGCVRDHLLGRPSGDVDAATPALPERVQELLNRAGIANVPTGLAHGTITALLPRKERKARPVEITTFRRDVATDGRHATVAFGGGMEEDAARRDFTMNALYLSPEGTLFDPTEQGEADARALSLRFVGNPATRIAEDGLRLLRFWRFAAQLGLSEWDSEARRACAEARLMLEDLSGERIQAEMRKLLASPAPGHVWNAMGEDGLLDLLVSCHPRAGQLDRFAAVERALNLPPQPMVRLAYLLGNDILSANWVVNRWKLSKADRALLLWLVGMPGGTPSLDAQRAAIRRQGRERGMLWLLWHAVAHPSPAIDHGLVELPGWQIPVFPVTGADLMALGFTRGPQIGDTLERLEAEWEKSGYSLSKDSLLKAAT